MRKILLFKYSNPILMSELIDTYPKQLIEGNNWNDRYWGVCNKTGIGQNQLGKALMEIREYYIGRRDKI